MPYPKFKVEGEVWFGNREFYSDKITEENDKEVEVKKNFFKKAWKNGKMDNIDSVSLVLQKYIPIIDARVEKTETHRPNNWFSLQQNAIGGDSKKLFFDEIIEKTKNNGVLIKFSKIFEERINTQKDNLKDIGYIVILSNYTLTTSSRLVVGLGGEHVLETSLTLHHIFGIPYIPATAFKGVVRMVSFWEIAQKRNISADKEIEELQKQLYDNEIADSEDEDFLRHKLLFGTQNFKGLLFFLDAYPEIHNNQEIFDVDVMNPHYSKYYTQGEPPAEEPPADWENPNPIVFLTLKKGIPFCFNVLFDEFRAKEILNEYNDSPETKKIPTILNNWFTNLSKLTDLVKEWIKTALEEYGVGAKTRVGYGRFE